MLVYRNPDDLRSCEERWFKIFSKKAFIAELVILPAAIILYLLIKGFWGFFLSFLLVLLVYVLMSVKVPYTMFLKGAGLPLITVILRRTVRKANKKILVKGIE